MILSIYTVTCIKSILCLTFILFTKNLIYIMHAEISITYYDQTYQLNTLSSNIECIYFCA